MLMAWAKQQKVAQILGSLTWENLMRFLAPGFKPGPAIVAFGGVSHQVEDLSLCVSLYPSLSYFGFHK